jgi:uncharacterized HAD superfamily protein
MSKSTIDLSDFDFGFSLVDEQELDAVQSAQQELQTVSSSTAEWQAQAEEWQAKANALYKSIMPLLDNLSQNEEKEYIYWPGRSEKISQFKLRLNQLLND